MLLDIKKYIFKPFAIKLSEHTFVSGFRIFATFTSDF
jgi:hypothetical protein